MWFVIGSVSGKAASTSSKKRCPSGSAGRSPPGIDRQHQRRLMGGEGEGLCGHLCDVAVVDVDLGPVAVDQAGSFSGGEVEIGRFVDRAELLRRKVERTNCVEL